MVLEDEEIETILSKLKEWSRAKRGIPFPRFHKNVSKVQHASKGIPTRVQYPSSKGWVK